MNESDLARFWSKVNKTETCWLWTASTREGYGLFSLEGKKISAHRLSYTIANPEVDIKYRQIRHMCDNPPCVNPKHLVIGTAKDNSDDKMQRQRHNFTFSDEQIKDIRSREVTYTMCRDLAEEFDCDPRAIKEILDGTRYGWIGGAIVVPPQFSSYKLTPEALQDILEQLSRPKWGTQTKLAKKYGVTRGTISHINKERVKYAQTEPK